MNCMQLCIEHCTSVFFLNTRFAKRACFCGDNAEWLALCHCVPLKAFVVNKCYFIRLFYFVYLYFTHT